MIVDLLGSLDGRELGTNVVNELGLCDGKVLGTTFGSLYGILLGTYDGTVLRSLEVSTEEIIEGEFEVSLLGARLVSLDLIELGADDVNAL